MKTVLAGQSSGRKDRKDWLKAGLHILSVEGEQALTIDALCKFLAVTKGSFYHHFRGRESYCESLLAFIEDSDTGEVIRRIENAGGDPEKRLQALMVRTGRLKKDFEPALRAWAYRDKMARRTQERIDHRRVEYIEHLFMESGFSSSVARKRARGIYALYLGASVMQPPMKGTDLHSLYRILGGSEHA